MNLFQHAAFLCSAPDLSQCPADLGAEVAFAGRSNAGKSSAINALTNNKQLARTSKTPGRTQLINFFDLGDERRLVDLPGYGYAKVSVATKERWQRNLSNYLQQRQSLRGLVVVMDIRHPMKDTDTSLIDWAVESNLPVHLLLTKADKLKKSQAKSVLLQLHKQLRDARVDQLVSLQIFSALKKLGLTELHQQMQRWLLEGQAD